MKIILVVSCVLLAGCSLGPFRIDHEDGKLPKFRVNVPKGKVRIRTNHKLEDVKLIWQYEFKIKPAIIREEINDSNED